jgi:hypothetical protein
MFEEGEGGSSSAMRGGIAPKPPEHPPLIQRSPGFFLPGVPVYGGLPFHKFPVWAHPHWPLGRAVQVESS